MIRFDLLLKPLVDRAAGGLLLSTCNEFVQRFYKTCITCRAGYLGHIIVCSLIGLWSRQYSVVKAKYKVLNNFRHLVRCVYVCLYDTYQMVWVWNIWLFVQIYILNHWLEPLVCPCWKAFLATAVMFSTWLSNIQHEIQRADRAD